MARRSLPAPSFGDYGEDEGGREEWLRNLALLVRQILTGRTNAVGDITLTNGGGTTTLTDERIGADSHITFMALTANAASDFGRSSDQWLRAVSAKLVDCGTVRRRITTAGDATIG